MLFDCHDFASDMNGTPDKKSITASQIPSNARPQITQLKIILAQTLANNHRHWAERISATRGRVA